MMSSHVFYRRLHLCHSAVKHEWVSVSVHQTLWLLHTVRGCVSVGECAPNTLAVTHCERMCECRWVCTKHSGCYTLWEDVWVLVSVHQTLWLLHTVRGWVSVSERAPNTLAVTHCERVSERQWASTKHSGCYTLWEDEWVSVSVHQTLWLLHTVRGWVSVSERAPNTLAVTHCGRMSEHQWVCTKHSVDGSCKVYLESESN